MSLAFPTNIGQRENKLAVLTEALIQLAPLACYVWDGQVAPQSIDPRDHGELATEIAGCSLIFLREGSRGRLPPIAGFIANPSLGVAKLSYLLDFEHDAHLGQLPGWTRDALGGYMHGMFSELAWLQAVLVPINLDRLDGMLGLKVTTANDVSSVILADLPHRPESSRVLP